MNSSPEKFFKRHVYSYSHNKSVELVAKKIVDGAAVDSLVYEYMLKKDSPYAKQTKVIKGLHLMVCLLLSYQKMLTET